MTRITLLLLTLLLAPLLATAQAPAPPDGTTIESAEVSGLERDQVSAELRRDIEALAGAALNRDRVTALAARIESERPDVVAAIRYLSQPDGRVRVVFVVARVDRGDDLASNINTRYTIERVDVSGIEETRISQTLRDQLQALVGGRLDDEEAARLKDRLEAELPDYHVSHRISRGDEPGRLRVDFNFSRTDESRWLRFTPSVSKVIYHEDQGWSTAFEPIQGSGNTGRFALGFAWNNNDDLIEEYSGVSFVAENVEAGTKRLGVGLEVSRYTQKWDAATRSALESNPDSPAAYRRRLTIQPTVSFALSRQVRFTVGVVAAELTPLADSSDSQRVNAALAEVGYVYRAPAAGHHLDASYQWRSGLTGLDSDLAYRRHSAKARYRFDRGRSTVIADVRLGRISGRAPLFERFAIGDSSTLRGWNKYAIAPIGASRMAYQSVEYRFHRFAYFLDAGALWDEGDDVRVRLATGVGFHAEHAFVTVGVPLNADTLSATFMLGVRF
jgi:hypothetical protein